MSNHLPGLAPPPSTARPCSYCGVPIEFIKGPYDAIIPVQRVRSVYFSVLLGDGTKQLRGLSGDYSQERYVSHWETCANVESAKAAQQEQRR